MAMSTLGRAVSLGAIPLLGIGLAHAIGRFAVAGPGSTICSASQIFPNRLEPISARVKFAVRGDLNGDGVDDVVAASQNSVLAVLGRRDGTVDPLPALTLGATIAGLALADLNQDGALDAVVTRTGASAAVVVLLNDGAGTLTVGGSTAIVGLASGPATADLDLDGAVDVVVGTMTSLTDGEILLLKGDDSGALVGPATVSPVQAQHVGIADLDDDGLLDIVATSSTDIHVLGGLGEGTFSAPTSSATPGNVKQLLLGDMNGDGRDDVVLVGSQPWLSVLLTDLDGAVGPAVSYTLSGTVRIASIGDIDGDGDLDIFGPLKSECVWGGSAHCVQLMLNDGSGSLGAAASLLVGVGPAVTVAGRFDGDASLDLLCFQDQPFDPSPTEQWIALVRGCGNGQFRTPKTIGSGGDTCVAMGDLDGDGDIDVVTGGLGTFARIHLNVGSGEFAAPVAVQMGVSADLKDAILVDLNSDGIVDLAMAREPYSSSNPIGVGVRLGLGGGALFGPVQLVISGGAGRAIAAGDLDGDGDVDLAISQWTPMGVALLTNNGQGVFSLFKQIPINASVWDIEIVDLDGNATPELVVASLSKPELWRFDDVATVPLPVGQIIPLPGAGPAAFFTCGDIDNDGDIDLVAMRCNQTQGQVCTLTSLLNDGNGVLVASPSSIIAAQGGSRIALADVTQDGYLDAVTSHFAHSGIGLLAGRGDGTFDAVGTFGCWRTSRTTLGDIDGDGDLDAICAGSALTVIRGAMSDMQPADATCDGVVDGADLGEMLAQWGACPGCPLDLNGDGQIGPDDLLLLLRSWGP